MDVLLNLSKGYTAVIDDVAATAGKFLAGIKAGGKRYHLGTFNTGKAAALAYDAAARRLFGDFALTNFPIEAS